jgi:hypothetical protein
MRFQYNDGGREAAGFKGKAGDCVTRAICIATGEPYGEVYDALAALNATYKGRRKSSAKGVKSARNGIVTRAKGFKEYMQSLGFKWTPTMLIGQGCKVHLADGELPAGRLVVAVSKHYTAVIEGTVHDTHDPQRDGSRCVYGYWQPALTI